MRGGNVRKWAAATALAAGGLATLTACGQKPVKVGSAPAVGQTVQVPTFTGAGSQVVPATSWPRACDMIRESDITTVLPTTTEVSTSQSDLKLGSLSFSGGGGIDYSTAYGASCVRDAHLDGTDDVISTDLSLKMLGTPDYVKEEYDHDTTTGNDIRLPIQPPAGVTCKASETEYLCRRGHVELSLSWNFPNEVKWQGQRHDGDGNRIYREKVAPKLLSVVFARIKDG